MKNYEWKRISESHEDSSHTYRYACEDFPGVTITRCNFRVPYAHKKGYWIAKKYFAEAENGLFREFRTKRECMEFVENGGFEDYEISKEEQHE